MILRNYFIVNLLFIVLIILTGIKAYDVFLYSYELPVKPDAKESTQETVPIAPSAGFPDESVYNVVYEKNIFSPSRGPESAPAQAAETAVSQEVPKLFGTIITGKIKSAFLSDPATKATRNYYVNDMIGVFQIKEIHEDMVVLSWGDETVEIRLRDDKNLPVVRQNISERKAATVNKIQKEFPIRKEKQSQNEKAVKEDAAQEEAVPPDDPGGDEAK
ncbi:MAG: hypothetical protein HY809_09820 [Nitrospirae bacterium]|nr:hypothetical protein [Nitrospirota bacterium]